MAVYVDSMYDWGKRIGHAGPRWAHLIGDDPTELHTFAQYIGLKRRWFQGDHYDIGTERMWRRAKAHGATHLTGQQWLDAVGRCRAVFRQE